MSTFSGKNDIDSGVRTKHIYSDAHNLRKICYLNGQKVGMVNYKLHFKTFENEDVTNTLRPENLTLEVFNVKEPYNVFHKGRIAINYDGEIKHNENEATFLAGSETYSFRFIAESQFKGILLVDKSLDFDTNQFGNLTQIEIDVMRNDNSFFHGSLLQNDARYMETDDSKFLIFSVPPTSGTIYYYDTVSQGWRTTNTYLGADNYLQYTNTRIDYDGTFNWDVTLRYSLDPYGYSEFKLLEIIDKSLFNLYRMFTSPIQNNDFWFNSQSFNFNLKYVTNIESVTYYGLGKSPVNGIVGINIEVKTISETEMNDSNLIIENIIIVNRIEIFPSDTLTTGISFISIYNDFIVYVYIPYKTNQTIIGNYLDDDGTIKSFRYFNLDFTNIELTIKKEYSDRTEYLGSDNYSVVSTVLTQVKELN